MPVAVEVGLDVSDACKLKTLEDETNKPKRLLAEQAMDNAELKEMISKTSNAMFKERCRGLGGH